MRDNTKKLMVDCETLGVGECPVICQIGAVVFDDNGIYAHFLVGVDTTNATELGFSIDQSTLDWWDKQDPAVRSEVFSGEELLPFALQKLVNFYQNNQCTEIWSKGSLADIRWINNALDIFEMEKPWKFSKEFCFRTLLACAPKFDMPFVGSQHNALDDAIHQVKQFIEIKRMQVEQEHRLIRQGQFLNAVFKKHVDLNVTLEDREAALRAVDGEVL